VKDRLFLDHAKKGWILDGYPRNTYQANYLDGYQKVDYVIVVNVSEDVSIKRISARLVCSECKAYYGLNRRPEFEGKCDECGGDLVQRDDMLPNLRVAISTIVANTAFKTFITVLYIEISFSIFSSLT